VKDSLMAAATSPVGSPPPLGESQVQKRPDNEDRTRLGYFELELRYKARVESAFRIHNREVSPVSHGGQPALSLHP
jgi:hypothetical protein